MKLTNLSPGIHAARRAGSMKHRPELQWAYGQITETDQDRWKAIEVEPPLTPWAPMEPNVCGDAPLQELPLAKDGHRQQRGATLRTGLTNETDAKKRRRACSGHSQRAAFRPTAEAYKDSTEKERGMEWVSDSDMASN